MNDEEVKNVLEILSSDIKRIETEFKKHSKAMQDLQENTKDLKKFLDNQNQLNSKDSEIWLKTARLLAEFSKQIDRMIYKFMKEDSFWHYYFSPTKVFFKTLFILVFSITLGFIAGRYTSLFKKDEIRNLYEHRENY
jgi:uncharacterized membrane protein (DUF106 family)